MQHRGFLTKHDSEKSNKHLISENPVNKWTDAKQLRNHDYICWIFFSSLWRCPWLNLPLSSLVKFSLLLCWLWWASSAAEERVQQRLHIDVWQSISEWIFPLRPHQQHSEAKKEKEETIVRSYGQTAPSEGLTKMLPHYWVIYSQEPRCSLFLCRPSACSFQVRACQPSTLTPLVSNILSRGRSKWDWNVVVVQLLWPSVCRRGLFVTSNGAWWRHMFPMQRLFLSDCSVNECHWCSLLQANDIWL